ncbi:MAG: DegT/DnrJ/EryC1/StrS family aminotransferase [Verrucomicrobia bacterium]|nr:DegT/DnrJ/EryC1/StrS family aminotransferase [Verrucomicrobiota bacterium]
MPLLTADPLAGYLAHADEIRAAIDRVLASGHYILGPEVEAFEREFAAYHGGGEAVGVANGTEAIELALRAVGVGRGDLVATVANTVTATVAAIEQIGARPCFVEIDAGTMLMAPAALESLLSARRGEVKAVVPVHLYGLPADLPAIVALARKHGAKVVEDCAQSHGARIAGRAAGTWGEAAAFSFYPTKNLGALGDGGAVLARDPAVAAKVRLLRQYGWKQRYVSDATGRNSRLDELQAAILRVKLRHLDLENQVRRERAARYLRRLAAAALRLPAVLTGAEPVWHQFAIRLPARDALRVYLADRGIQCGILYPVPVHRQPAFADPATQLPETERACAEVLCLPVHPAVTEADVDRVSDEILRWRQP